MDRSRHNCTGAQERPQVCSRWRDLTCTHELALPLSFSLSSCTRTHSYVWLITRHSHIDDGARLPGGQQYAQLVAHFAHPGRRRKRDISFLFVWREAAAGARPDGRSQRPAAPHPPGARGQQIRKFALLLLMLCLWYELKFCRTLTSRTSTRPTHLPAPKKQYAVNCFAVA